MHNYCCVAVSWQDGLMELAALVRSVLKLSAGIQLAPRSSLGCGSSPPCQLAAEHTVVLIHDRHLQKKKKAKKKKKLVKNTRGSWTDAFNETFSARKKKKKKWRRGRKPTCTQRKGKEKNAFSSVLSQGRLGHLGKVYSTRSPKHYSSMSYVECDAAHIQFHWCEEAVKKEDNKGRSPLTWMLFISMFSICLNRERPGL